jgi:hypothetical protein
MPDFIIPLFVIIYQFVSVVTPALNYVPQYLLMHREQITGTFARQICFILICSSTLRISFWFKKRYEVCLLLQSFVVLLLQIMLLYKFIQIRLKNQAELLRNRGLTIYSGIMPKPYKKLLQVLTPYMVFFSIFIAVFMYLESEFVTEVTGSLAGTLETLLPLPQIAKVWRHKSVRGLRYANKFHDDLLLVVRRRN